MNLIPDILKSPSMRRRDLHATPLIDKQLSPIKRVKFQILKKKQAQNRTMARLSKSKPISL